MNASFVFIGLGGALGAVSRVWLMRVLPIFFYSLPMQILLVNVIGCFFMGALVEVLAFYWEASPNTRRFLVQGFLGGFTTFSSFALEFGDLYKQGKYFTGASYVVLSVILSLAFFFFGLKTVRAFV
jgi:fluoride exporter